MSGKEDLETERQTSEYEPHICILLNLSLGPEKKVAVDSKKIVLTGHGVSRLGHV